MTISTHKTKNIFGIIIAGFGLLASPARTDNINTLRIMAETGFLVLKSYPGSAVFKPAGHGKFDVIIRFAKSNMEDAERCSPVNHKRRGSNGYVCEYSNWVPPVGFLKALSSGTMTPKSLWASFPEIAKFVDPPVKSATLRAKAFLTNPELNAKITNNSYRIYQTCWTVVSDRVTQMVPYQRADCRGAKDRLRSEVLQERYRKAVAESERSKAAAKASVAERRFFEQLLEALTKK